MILSSKAIGGKIAEVRKNAQLSQAELAQQISISPQAVGKWERGESMPDIITLNRLATLFKVDLNYFANSFSSESIEKADEVKNQNNQTIVETKPTKRLGQKWNMSQGNWADGDFSGLNHLQEKFSGSNMKNCKFYEADLSSLYLGSNNVEKCDFTQADLRNSKIASSNLSNNVFNECSLIDAEFTKSNVEKCEFSEANFSGAEFVQTNFGSNQIAGATWIATSFKTSSLSDITFNGMMEDCSFEDCSFSRVRFQKVQIKSTFFKGRKLKGIIFEDCQADRLTYEFLKNGKADLTGISLMD